MDSKCTSLNYFHKQNDNTHDDHSILRGNKLKQRGWGRGSALPKAFTSRDLTQKTKMLRDRFFLREYGIGQTIRKKTIHAAL